MVDRKSFVSSIANLESVHEHWVIIDACASQGDLDTLRDLFIQTFKKYAFGPSETVPRAVCERIVHILTFTTGYETAKTAIDLCVFVKEWEASHRSHSTPLIHKLFSAKPSSSRQLTILPQVGLPSVIAKLVAAQPSEVIDRLLAQNLDLDLSAIILHEAVVRGKLIQGSRAAQDTNARILSKGHPLSRLPLALLDIETKIQLPIHKLNVSYLGRSSRPESDENHNDLVIVSDEVTISESTTKSRQNQIAAAIKYWPDGLFEFNELNENLETRVFSLPVEAMSLQISQYILTIGLECLGPSEESVHDVYNFQNEIDIKDIFSTLFSAACSGGAYYSSQSCAYGRLLAWRSLAGLIGSHEEFKVEEISGDASDCKWLLFNGENDWWHQHGWDIGIACANPATNELAVLAATDSD